MSVSGCDTIGSANAAQPLPSSAAAISSCLVVLARRRSERQLVGRRLHLRGGGGWDLVSLRRLVGRLLDHLDVARLGGHARDRRGGRNRRGRPPVARGDQLDESRQEHRPCHHADDLQGGELRDRDDRGDDDQEDDLERDPRDRIGHGTEHRPLRATSRSRAGPAPSPRLATRGAPCADRRPASGRPRPTRAPAASSPAARCGGRTRRTPPGRARGRSPPTRWADPRREAGDGARDGGATASLRPCPSITGVSGYRTGCFGIGSKR